ncbi:MAG: uridine kinase [Bacteroidetes bacterium]|nr:uridine kinase [Bacteroidota bacterium]MDA0878822.1 uridine kinase [Bacteroidota bacterium]MDA1115190.1 uridine kinase [Bacteroidota bacterium]
MLIIGIAGGTACGKTTVVNQLLEELSKDQVNLISQDSYYKDNSHLSYEERCAINFDHPNSIDFPILCQHVQQLKMGQSVDQPIYSFEEHNRTGQTLRTEPSAVLIIEGILVLTDPQLRDLLDIKLFVHADADERLIRRIKRDTLERGRDLTEILNRYQSTLKPMHDEFIEPSKVHADIIIPNNNHNTVAINIAKSLIKNR